MCDYTGWRNMWMRWRLNKMCQVKCFREDVNLEYSQTEPFRAFTVWRNLKMCDYTGCRNMWIMWCLNKTCHIKAF